MESTDLLYRHKETRLSFEPPSSALVVDIKFPYANRQRWSEKVNGTAEEIFKANNCATASSVYHRKHHSAPKSILWRVLEGDTILSIRAIDVCKSKRALDCSLILNIRFAKRIRPSCVALSDPHDHDSLSVFVIDQDGRFHTLALRPDFFRKRSATETGLADCCKVHDFGSISYKKPHRLVAVNDNLLVVTVHDGGLIKLEKNRGHDALYHPWKETSYNSNNWRDLISLDFIKKTHTVNYNGTNMAYTASTSSAATDLGLKEAAFLFTVCLDHRLRVWNLANGQLVEEPKDLLNAKRNPQEIGKWTIDPSQTNLIKIVDETEGRSTCVTYSPVGAGQFKFWTVEAGNDLQISIKDRYPTREFVPQPPTGSDVWTLADFAISPRKQEIQFWVLWKNNMTYRVQNRSLSDRFEDAWQTGWSGVYLDDHSPIAEDPNACDPADATEKWLQVILYPGRFTKATLEAALSIYEKGLLGTKKVDVTSKSSKGFAEALCSVLGSELSLDRSSTGGMNYEQFRFSSNDQWRRFHRLLEELNKPRGEALGLVCEPEFGTSWVVCADIISAIRECNPLENIHFNPKDADGEYDQMSTLISTGLNFIGRFQPTMLQICNAVLRSELFEDSSKTDFERIQFISDKAGFWRQITDEDCAQVTDILGPNFNLVTEDLYEETLALMDAPADSKRDPENPLTEFGCKLAVKAAQDVSELHWNICFSQLILLVHMEFEFDRPEDALHNRVDIGIVYRGLIQSLKRLELVKWLAKTQISQPLYKTERSGSMSGSSSVIAKRPTDDFQTITALEGNVHHLLGFSGIETAPAGITNLVTNLCAQDSSIQIQPEVTQEWLLRQNRPDLAAEVGPFCDGDSFSTYVQGRVYLALKDFSGAAVNFKKAAYGLSVPTNHRSSHPLLDETERRMLHAGMPQYYAHIVALYEKHKAHSYVVEFARLALQFVNTQQAQDAVDLRTEIQSRLFIGAVNIAQFDLAHSTLVAMQNRALQRSSLGMLITKMCDNLHNSDLVNLPFPNLENAVDEFLTEKCKTTFDVVTGVPYHQILYAWRVKRNDYRGAAAILLDRIQKLRLLGEANQLTGDDILDSAVTRQYLMLINVLSCVDQKQAWITTEEVSNGASQSGFGSSKRQLKTLADIRREYQDELDRIAAIQNNQFGFSADDEMDIVI